MPVHSAAGVMDFKSDIKKAKWLPAYEDWNVSIGCETGTLHFSAG
jgi:malate synthase